MILYVVDLYIPWHIQAKIYVRPYIFIYFIRVSCCHSIAQPKPRNVRMCLYCVLCAYGSQCFSLSTCSKFLFLFPVTIAGWSLSLYSRDSTRSCVCVYVFLFFSLPRTFMGCCLALVSAQLTLSLNNIKIMSNKSDTANEMDVHYVAVAFSNIGIILPLLLFVFVVVVGKENSFLFRFSLIFSCSFFSTGKIFQHRLCFWPSLPWVLITETYENAVLNAETRFYRVAEWLSQIGVFCFGCFFFLSLN